MKCEQARAAIGAEPRGSSTALEQHLATCADCSGYQREMHALETQLGRALALPVGSAAGSRNVTPLPQHAPPVVEPVAAPPAPTSTPWRGWALAASLLLTVLLGVFVAGGRDGEALAADIVEHMAGEIDSWDESREIPQSALDLVLRRSRVRLDRSALGDVVYAHSCWFRGHWVPHLVLRTETGPVTVMVLPAESVDRVQRFDEGGYSGVIAPAPVGAVAVLGRGEADVDAPLARVQRALAAVVQPDSTDQPP